MNTPETINIEKYAEALNNLIGVDSAYMSGDKDVDAIVELIVAAKKLENRVRELTEENIRLIIDRDLYRVSVADIVREMQALFKTRLDISVCGYSTEEVVDDVLDTFDRVVNEILEEKNNV